ncbi:hypothetical protein [Marinicauda algicola]|uniref:hypothetical protein n=1 Tax=Marinicauda algicola TaxID=2029849 RepID=UPI0019D2E0DF|nr:hypothetical protein [Marinicauda algicola]
MSLPPAYLEYDKRGYGQDIGRYDWRLAKDRAPVRLKNARQVAAMIVIPCEYHPIDPHKTPFGHPTAWSRPSRTFATSPRATTATGSGCSACSRAEIRRAEGDLPGKRGAAHPRPPARRGDRGRRHELAAAGLHGDAIHHAGLSESEERAMIEDVREAFDAAGSTPRPGSRRRARRALQRPTSSPRPGSPRFSTGKATGCRCR